MGKTKPKYDMDGIIYESRIIEAEKIPLELKFVEFSKQYKIPKKLTALMKDADFVFRMKADCFLHKCNLLKYSRIPNLSQIMAAINQIGEEASDLQNHLLGLDQVTTRFFIEAGQELEESKRPSIELLTFFERLMHNLENLVSMAIKTKERFKSQSYSHKDFSNVILAVWIKNLLIEKNVKPTVYRSGVWCILLMIALACQNIYVDQETAFNILRESKNIKTGWYGETFVIVK